MNIERMAMSGPFLIDCSSELTPSMMRIHRISRYKAFPRVSGTFGGVDSFAWIREQ